MIGFDLQEVERIKDPEKLLCKIAVESEVAYIRSFSCDFAMHVASLWAVKEACFKALDCSAGEISYREIQLSHKENGAPILTLSGNAKRQMEKLGAKKIEVSLSHQKSVVGAVVVLM